ncbi:MAG: aspartate--tRNA(Asn) ligase [Thermoproteus sp. AZ2]|uniref:Aspartate--tRNA(Asn) ligase n=1 Tax=Thermoproteus sp. AZ2 TaxID=1609232 RepID=A0ACC6UZQ5_9CREN|nr:MAG: aspartyl-tRNA synthetase [Thermoproteus sp. AZ2]
MKTHFTSEVTPELNGKEVVLAGWVWEVRQVGKVKFVVLRDREGFVQITFKPGRTPDELLEAVKELNKEDVIMVKGVVEASRIARAGVEVFPTEMRVLAKAKPLPVDIWQGTSDLPTRLKYRAVDLKSPRNLAIFSAASDALRAIREALYAHKFVEVFTPKIIATSTEGGAELFPVLYFERVAYLAQSPQLYKEQLTASLERVFEIAPAYRAEKHNTDYHLNEFISVDGEAAFFDYRDVMDLLEKIMGAAVSAVARSAERLERWGIRLTLEKVEKIPRVDYDDAVDRLRAMGYDINWGDDLNIEMQRALTKEYGPIYFVVNFPAALRPFYTKRLGDDPRKTESYDLILNGIEVVSGATRIHVREELEREMRGRGLDPAAFESHLSVFDWGMPPHAGFGLGFNRLITALFGLGNVREATLYPRDRYRLEP